MFNIDEKHLYPMGKPNPDTGMFPPPPPPHHEHHPPTHTIPETVELLMAEVRASTARLLEFERRLESRYDDMSRHLTADNVQFKQTFAEAHRQFIQDVKNEVNVFEGNMNAALTLFQKTMEAEIHARLLEQDETINSAVDYMKDNLADSIAESVNEMKESGEFTDIIEGEVFGGFEDRLSRAENMFKTPEQYGAAGDGIVNDDEAMTACIADLHDGDTLVLNGMYLVTQAHFNNVKNLRVVGSGGFALAENASLHAIEFNNCDGLIIDGIEIDGKYRTARALNIYNVNDFEIRNVYIHDVGNNAANNSIYGIILVNSHNGRIVNPRINYVHASSIATGINMESDGESVYTTPTNIVIDGALIEDISPVDDADGVKVLGTIESNITVMNSVFKKCAKRAIKFQSIGCTSFNNKIYSAPCGYACIDFQRKNGKSLNDTIYVDVPATAEVTGLGYYGVVCSDNTLVDGLNVHVNGHDSALYGACTSSNLFGIQNLGEDEKIRVVIKNCKIDAWGYFLKNTAEVACELVVDNVHIDRLYMNYLFTGGHYVNLVFTNNRIIQKPKSWFIFAHNTNCTIDVCDIDLTNVMTAEWNISDRPLSTRSRIIARCGDDEFSSGSFTYENGRMTFFGERMASPETDIYSSGKWFEIAEIGDVYKPKGIASDGDNRILYWVCTALPSASNSSRGVWIPVYA